MAEGAVNLEECTLAQMEEMYVDVPGCCVGVFFDEKCSHSILAKDDVWWPGPGTVGILQ